MSLMSPGLLPDLALGRRFVERQPLPGRPLLVGVTGSHDYGFPSADSDLDLKGIHLAPIASVLGLGPIEDTFDRLEVYDGVECDLTSHEAKKALGLLLRGNGNMLERIMTPFQLFATPELDELRALLPLALSTRCHAHYRGFFAAQCREHERGPEPRAKTLLYAYRVALTGIRLLTTGEVVADLRENAPRLGFPEALDLIALKQAGTEKGAVTPEVDAHHRANWPRLEAALDAARAASPLPEAPRDPQALSDWLVAARRRHGG